MCVVRVQTGDMYVCGKGIYFPSVRTIFWLNIWTSFTEWYCFDSIFYLIYIIK